MNQFMSNINDLIGAEAKLSCHILPFLVCVVSLKILFKLETCEQYTRIFLQFWSLGKSLFIKIVKGLGEF